MLLGTLVASLLGNILPGKGAIAKRQGRRINTAGEGILRAGYGNKRQDYENNGFLMPPHPLTNSEMQKYQNEPRFNGVYSRDILSRIKDGEYIINLDECSDIGTHWVALHVQNNDVTYFDSFRKEHISKEINTFIGNKNIKTSIFRIQAYDSIMCRYFCIGFIDFMLAGKTLTEFTNLFSPNNFKKNDDIILNYFMSNI